MKKDKLKFGVLGVGRIGKVHVENLTNQIAETDVVAISDVFPSELEKVAQKYNIETAVLDYKDVLNNPAIDAVTICTPTDTHYQIILDAAAAGKHIFCEKPIDLAIDKIKKINDTIKKTGVKMMVAFNRRFDPNFSKVHDVVAAGKIGESHVLKITSRDPAPPPVEYLKSSGGIFLDMTIHDFDMARFLVGSEVTEVYAKTNVLVDPVFKKVGDWDTAIVTLSFKNGAIGTIDNSRQAVYGYDQRVEVFGSKGVVAADNNRPDNHIFINREGTHSALPLFFFMERYMDSYLNEMKAFVAALKNNTPMPVDGNDGLQAVVIGLAAMKSAKENRPVKLSEILK
ncbi:inositol 2-dehydrogenase [candidate division KSB1 bacterium]|nr:inositol 2-dehydrogenase [candidate division KSB1 bacterium]